MNVLNFDSQQCERIRRNFDAYLSNELLVETTADVLRHLEGCAACREELEARTRVREALRRAALSQTPPEELRHSVERALRRTQPSFFEVGLWPRLALAGVALLLLVIATAHFWMGVTRGRRMVESILALGVSDHVQCAVQGHNYPEQAKPAEQLRQQLGPEYASLLDVVQQKLPGFEVLEAHICSIPGSPRKYVHFITRGHGTILSVILTRRDRERLPPGSAFTSGTSDGVELYEAHLQGMNAAGFEATQYWGFVVSDLGRDTIFQIARQLAPPLKAAMDAASGPPKQAMLKG
jgi:hypothetical protein